MQKSTTEAHLRWLREQLIVSEIKEKETKKKLAESKRRLKELIRQQKYFEEMIPVVEGYIESRTVALLNSPTRSNDSQPKQDNCKQFKVNSKNAVELYSQCKSIKKVSKILSVSSKTVADAIRRWEKEASEQVLPGRGRPRKKSKVTIDDEK